MTRRLLLTIRHAYAMWRVLSLPKNKAKGGWHHLSPYALLDHAEREMQELRAAVWKYQYHHGPAHRVRDEAADLSAFAAMVSDVCRD